MTVSTWEVITESACDIGPHARIDASAVALSCRVGWRRFQPAGILCLSFSASRDGVMADNGGAAAQPRRRGIAGAVVSRK